MEISAVSRQTDYLSKTQTNPFGKGQPNYHQIVKSLRSNCYVNLIDGVASKFQPPCVNIVCLHKHNSLGFEIPFLSRFNLVLDGRNGEIF